MKIGIPHVSNLPVLLHQSSMACWVVPCGKWPSAELYDWGGVCVSKVVKKGLFDAKVHLMPILSCPHVNSESPNLLLGGWYTTVWPLICVCRVDLVMPCFFASNLWLSGEGRPGSAETPLQPFGWPLPSLWLLLLLWQPLG